MFSTRASIPIVLYFSCRIHNWNEVSRRFCQLIQTIFFAAQFFLYSLHTIRRIRIHYYISLIWCELWTKVITPCSFRILPATNGFCTDGTSLVVNLIWAHENNSRAQTIFNPFMVWNDGIPWKWIKLSLMTYVVWNTHEKNRFGRYMSRCLYCTSCIRLFYPF